MATGTVRHTLVGHENYVRAFVFTPDEQRIISASSDATLKVWDLNSGQEIYTLEGHGGWVRAVDVTPDGLRAVSVSWDDTLIMWDLQEGTGIAEFTGESRLLSCAILPDGKTIVAGERSGRLHFLKLEGLDEGDDNFPHAEF